MNKYIGHKVINKESTYLCYHLWLLLDLPLQQTQPHLQINYVFDTGIRLINSVHHDAKSVDQIIVKIYHEYQSMLLLMLPCAHIYIQYNEIDSQQSFFCCLHFQDTISLAPSMAAATNTEAPSKAFLKFMIS